MRGPHTKYIDVCTENRRHGNDTGHHHNNCTARYIPKANILQHSSCVYVFAKAAIVALLRVSNPLLLDFLNLIDILPSVFLRSFNFYFRSVLYSYDRDMCSKKEGKI